MFKIAMKCSCGASYKVMASPEEYKDASYTVSPQIDNWMIAHNNHTPLPPQSSTPPINENPLGLDDSDPL